MSDLAEFLLARIAEDEAVARTAHGLDKAPGHHDWYCDDEELTFVTDDRIDQPAAAHISLWSPRRVLAECEAKRQVVESYKHHAGRYDEERHLGGIHMSLRNTRDTLFWVMLRLALPYADHPDYREEWKP